MRTLLRRVLLGPFIIPPTWTIMWTLGWLLSGAQIATDMCKELTKAIWYGEEE